MQMDDALQHFRAKIYLDRIFQNRDKYRNHDANRICVCEYAYCLVFYNLWAVLNLLLLIEISMELEGRSLEIPLCTFPNISVLAADSIAQIY